MTRLKLKSKVLLVFMSIMLIFNSFIHSSIKVYAEDYSGLTRAKNSIAIWSEKSTLSSTNSDEFTKDDVWVMGVLASNYYVPWSTIVYGSGGLADSESASDTRTNIVEALTNNFSVDESVADAIVNVVVSQSNSTAQQLYIGYDDGYNDVKASWGVAFHLFFDPNFNNELDAAGVDNVQFYWKDESGGNHVVFDHGISRKDDIHTTYCDLAMQMIYGQYSASIKSGYGMALFGTAADVDPSADKDVLYSFVDSYSKNGLNFRDTNVYKQSLFVDTFGNILCDNQAGRVFVAVPACLNPYTYIKDGKSAGHAMPLLNLRSFAESDNGTLIAANTTSSFDTITFNARPQLTQTTTAILRGSEATDLGSNNPFSSAFSKGAELLTSIETDFFASEYAPKVINYMPGRGGANYSFIRYGRKNAANMKNQPVGGKNVIYYGNLKADVIQDFILFDTLNLESGSAFSSSAVPSMVSNPTGIFSSSWQSFSATGTGNKNKFSNSTVQMDNGFNFVEDDYYRAYLNGILASYIFAYYKGMENSTNATGGESATDSAGGTVVESDDGSVVGLFDKVHYTFNTAGLPEITCSSFKIIQSDAIVDTDLLIKWMYYIMHPTQGIEYVRNLIKKFTTTFMLDTHERIVGNTATNSTTGSVKYLSFSSFVATPNLNDMEWSKTFMSWFSDLYIYFIIAMILILICHVVIGNMTVQRAILGIVLFALVAYLPPVIMNFSINTSNLVSDKLYGNKFTYWAVVQHETYMQELETAMEEGSSSDILIAQFQNYIQDSALNSTVVTLKWQTPKKYIATAGLSQYLKDQEVSPLLSNILVYGVQNQTDGQTKIQGVDSYIYRSYTDLAMTNYKMYNWMNHGGAATINPTEAWLGLTTDYGTDLGNQVSSGGYLASTSLPNALPNAQSLGFNYNAGRADNNYNSSYAYRILELTASNSISQEMRDGLTGISLNNPGNLGIEAEYANVAITDLSTNPSQAEALTEKNSLGYLAYFSYTESPFYYLANNLSDQLKNSKAAGVVSSKTVDSGYKGMFLEENGDYFYNNVLTNGVGGYGELRDYMDMRTLFYLVIPYLKAGNDVVTEFDNKYGFFLYDDVDVDYLNPDKQTVFDLGYDIDSEYYYKWWHNVTVSQLNNLYCPWVDLMYGCDYSKPETIYVLDKKYTVEDPLDPYTYYKADASGNITEGRYMVFSESEMKYYGLSEGDLTEVERRIIKLNKDVYGNLIQVMDYYTFNENVVNTMAAMIETFAFNKAFSEHGMFKENIILYPQAFELKNFTYDAYLRLILSEATGESLQQSNASSGVSQSLYKTILDNTSFLTGIAMIIADALAMYVIPAAKLIFILLIIILSFLIICTAVLNIEISLPQVILDSLVKPLGGFIAISVGMAAVISAFMSDGNTAVTNRKTFTISLGDPTMTLIIMLVINVLAVALLGIIVYGLIKDTWKYLKIVALFIKGTILGVVKGIIGGTIAKLTGRLNRSDVSSAGYATAASTGVSASRTLTANTVRVKNITQETKQDNKRVTNNNIYNKHVTNTQNNKTTNNNTTTNNKQVVNNTTNNSSTSTSRTRVNSSGSRVNKSKR